MEQIHCRPCPFPLQVFSVNILKARPDKGYRNELRHVNAMIKEAALVPPQFRRC
jgi:hypothetical protein